MSAELIGILGVGVSLAAFTSVLLGRLDKRLTSRLDKLETAHHQLACEVAELRCELRGRFGLQPATGD